MRRLNPKLRTECVYRKLRTTSAFGLAVALCGCSSPAERAGVARDEGTALMAQGDYLGARARFDAAVAIRDDSPELWVNRARSQVALKDYAGALQSYSAALDLDRANREALEAVGQIALLANNTERASRIADQITALDPSDPTGLFLRASVMLQRGRLVAADQLLQSALRAHPKDERLLVLQARLLLRQGKPIATERLLRPLFNQGSSNPALLEALRRSYEQLYLGRELLRVTARAVKAAPDNADVYGPFAQQLLANGLFLDGLRTLVQRSQMSRARSREEWSMIDTIVDSNPNLDKLVALLDATRPLQGDALRSMARFLILQGRLGEALRLLQRLPFQQRDTEWTAINAYALAQANRRAEARANADQALSRDPSATFALLARSTIFAMEGRRDEALRDARQAALDAPTFVEPVMVLSALYRSAGDERTARNTVIDAYNRNRGSALFLRAHLPYLPPETEKSDLDKATREFSVRRPISIEGWRIRLDVCAKLAKRSCAGRAVAIIANLHSKNVVVPHVPDGEEL